MFSNILARTTIRLPSQQQVRFVRKTFRYRYAYGIEPLVTEDSYQEAVQEGRIEQLKFEPVRFASVSHTPSVLYDKEYDVFTKYVMKGGRRSLADDLMQQTFYCIKSIQYLRKRKSETADEVEMNPMVIFKKALQNSQPVVITKKVKRGGATYQVPFPLCQSQSEYFAIKWLIKAVLERPKPRLKPFEDVMAQELIDASENRGKVVKRKDDMHKLADANKAYAHYRWG